MYDPGQCWCKELMAGKQKFLGITAHCQHALFVYRNGTSLGGLSQGPLALLWVVGTWEGCRTSHLKHVEFKAS